MYENEIFSQREHSTEIVIIVIGKLECDYNKTFKPSVRRRMNDNLYLKFK